MTHHTEANSPTHNAGRLLNGLDFLWLELTGKCNLECVHCYAESGPTVPLSEKMTYTDWHETLRQGADLGCHKVQFIGGEATLHPDLQTLVADAHRLGYSYIEVYTNATHLTPALLETFQRYQVRLGAAVYAHQPEIHDAITRRKGSFVKTMAGLRQAVAHGIPVRVGIVTMELNAHCVEETKQMLRDLGISDLKVDRLRGIGRGEPLLGNSAPALTELCGACWKGQLCVDSGGRVFPCTFSKFNPIGMIDQGLKALVESAELRTFRVAVREMVEQRLQASPGCPPDSTGTEGCPPDTTQPEGCPPDTTEPEGCPPDTSTPEGCPPEVSQSVPGFNNPDSVSWM